MADAVATATVTEGPWDDGQRIHAVGTISIAAGDYVAGGLPLSFAGLVPSEQPPVHVDIYGIAGFEYKFVKGSSPANGKIMARVNDAGGTNAAMAQHSAVAVVSGITGDTIRFHSIHKKLI